MSGAHLYCITDGSDVEVKEVMLSVAGSKTAITCEPSCLTAVISSWHQKLPPRQRQHNAQQAARDRLSI